MLQLSACVGMHSLYFCSRQTFVALRHEGMNRHAAADWRGRWNIYVHTSHKICAPFELHYKLHKAA